MSTQTYFFYDKMDKEKKKINKSKKIYIGVAAVLLILGVVALLLLNSFMSRYSGVEKRIYISQNISKDDFHKLLNDSLGDYGDKVFSSYAKLDGSFNIPSGSYVIKPGEKAFSTARKIQSRRQDPVRFTFNNLRTLDQLADRADSQLEFTKEDFLAVTDSILSGQGVSKENYSAHFLPDTYEFYWTDTPEKVVTKILDNYSRFWTDEHKTKASALNLTPDQVATLASIVESETVMSDERPKVARLYLNRLQKGMLLQADPTVIFGIGDFTIRRVTKEHLKSDSPYNTYKYKGLPPGPIRIPAAKSLEAVLNAPANDYIFMCAKEDFSGYHNFAVSYDEHIKNAARYQKKLDEKGIK